MEELKLLEGLKLMKAPKQLEAEDTMGVDEGHANQGVLEHLDCTCLIR